MQGFHEALFPLDVALGARGGPERRTSVVMTGSGHEERNTRWAHSRRRYDAGYGVKSLDDLAAVIAFFEERRGRLYGFRWRDRADCKSCLPSEVPGAADQFLGNGDGVRRAFQLVKTYGGMHAPYVRPIAKPVAGSVVVAVDGAVREDVGVDVTRGEVVFDAAPGAGAVVTAGFLFDVPVRFETDALEVDLSAFRAGEIPSIPLVEVRV